MACRTIGSWRINSTPASQTLSVPDVATRAQGFGLPGVIVDGQDALAVYEAARAAVTRARGGGGPTLMECKTYRFHSHSAFAVREPRPADEIALWKARDPIELLGARLEAAGIDLVNIPYKGTGQAQVALLSNEIQFFVENPLIAVPSIKGGKIRALAVTSRTRNPVLPDLPTVEEAAGLPGYENVTWHSFAFPAGVPKPVLKKMHDEIVKALKSPDVADKIRAQGLEPVGNTPEELSARIKKEWAEYRQLVKEIGYQPQ